MGKVTTSLTLTNRIDQILAERGFIRSDEVRSLTLNHVLVDTGATRLYLPADVIAQLGLVPQGEVDIKLAVGVSKVRIFRELSIAVGDREGTFNCIELPAGDDRLLGVIPLDDLGLEPDLQRQTLRVLPQEGRETYLTAQ